VAIDPAYWPGSWLDCDWFHFGNSTIYAMFIATIFVVTLCYYIYIFWGWAAAKRADINADRERVGGGLGRAGQRRPYAGGK
jgi:hypothetical protein